MCFGIYIFGSSATQRLLVLAGLILSCPDVGDKKIGRKKNDNDEERIIKKKKKHRKKKKKKKILNVESNFKGSFDAIFNQPVNKLYI